jgi:hypothetical protein
MSQISESRKAVYYAGMVLTGIGLVSFLSLFFTVFTSFGTGSRHGGGPGFGAAVAGMVMMIAGGFLMNLGKQGLAGSGILLDPERTREDLKPWNRMAGGMLQDSLSQVRVVQKLEERLDNPAPEVKLRCRSCQALNDEKAKFCNQCGQAV